MNKYIFTAPLGAHTVNSVHPCSYISEVIMVHLGLFVRLEAKPGYESAVENFLRDALPLVQEEAQTSVWFGVRLGERTFAIFDAFADEAGRDAHLAGKVAAALMEKAPELLAESPVIEKLEILATKLP